MGERTIEDEPEILEFVPDHFKTPKICYKAVRDDPYSLKFVSNWFVTHKQVKYGMMTMIMMIMMMMRLLSGTMVIKNARHRKQK